MDNRSNAMMGFRRHIKALSWLTLIIFSGQLSVATAGSIVADSSAPGNQRPSVTQTANGVPQVNIQTPSAAGVSRNSYQQFDVNNKGVILNNARTNTQTQLGGWIQGNPSLAGGSARIILNEVNSANPSLLNGAIEVGGSQAQVVIANPAGVTCDGCGFINANRATLTTGKAIMNGGNLEGYLVERGTVKIQGSGLDSSQSNYTDIIARSVEVNAGIWANDLKVTAGANRVSTDHNSITPITGTGEAPSVAIDVGSLGGMYAGKIHLIGTESGVGVNNAGALGASSGQFIVTASGTIQNSGQISGQGAVSLNSESDITNTGSIASKTAITVNAQGDINNTAAILSLGELELSANSLSNVSGLIRSAQTATITAASINNSNTNGANQGIEGHNVMLDSDLLNNTQGAVRADDTVTVLNSGTLANQQGLISAGNQLNIRDRLASSSSNNASKTLSITNTNGSLIADSELVIDSKSLTGDGKVISAGDLTTKLSDSYTHTGEWQADNDATFVTAGTLNNHAELSAGNLLDITAATLDNKATGDITATTTKLTATSANTLINRGLIDGSNTYLNAITLNNLGTGRIYGDHIAIEATTLNNQAEGGDAPVIAARNRLDIGASYLTNNEHALLFSAGDLSIGGSLDANHFATGQAVSVTNSSATIEALGNLNIATATLNNTNAHFATTQVLTTTNFSEVDMGQDCSRQYAMPGCRGNWIEDTTHHDYTKKVYTPVVSESDPAKILAGGSMTLYGSNLTNDKSHIIAGGVLQGDLGNINNIAAQGTETSELRDSYRIHQKTSSGYKWRGPSVHNVPLGNTTVDLAVTRTEGNTSVSGTGTTVDDLTAVNVSQQAEVTGSGIPSSVSLPNNSLFHILPAPSNRYLIETDPQFTSYRTWLSSDYMLTQLALDPTTTLKRLGDGFYEQRLLREQITQLTGRRFLEGYGTDESQYQALMMQGVSYAKKYQLKLGVALTAAQIAQLTSDIVWLVEQSVTLADGSVQQVLVPQVYLKPRTGDLHHDGTLIAAEEINLNLSGDLHNSGTIAGRTITQITAENIDNVGGYVVADVTKLNARKDINNIGGTLAGKDRLSLNAGRDITIETTTLTSEQKTDKDHFTRTNIDRIAGLYVSNPNGTLLVSAGNNITLAGAEVINQGEGGRTTLNAGHDLNINTVTESNLNSTTWDSRNHAANSSNKELGSTIEGQGDIQLAADNDVSLRAAKVSSEEGNLIVSAGNNLTIEAGQTTQNEDIALRNKKRSYQRKLDATTHTASTLSGKDVTLSAGKDLNIIGSEVEADNDLAIAAKGDVNIKSVQDTSYSFSRMSKKKSFGRSKSKSVERYTLTNQGSELNAGNNLTINAEINDKGIATRESGQVNIDSSDLTAEKQLVINADEGLSITAQQDINYEKTVVKKSGFLGLKKSASSDMTDVRQLAQSNAATKQDDLSLLSGEDITLVAANIDSGKDLNLNAEGDITITAGLESTSSEHQYAKTSFLSGGNLFEMEKSREVDTALTTKASELSAEQDININASRATVVGSTLTAEHDINATTDVGDIQIITAQEAINNQSEYEKVKLSMLDTLKSSLIPLYGISFEDGVIKSKQGEATYDKVDTTSDQVLNVASQFLAGNDINLHAAGDILIEGSDLAADTDGNGAGDINLTTDTGDVIIKEAIDARKETRDEIHAKAEASITIQNDYVEAAKAVIALNEAKNNLKQAREDYRQYQKDLKNFKQQVAQLEQDYNNQVPGVSYDDLLDAKAILDDMESDEDWYQVGISTAAYDVVTKTQAVVGKIQTAASSSYTYGFAFGFQLDIEAEKTESESQTTTARSSNLSGQNIRINTGVENARANTATTIQGSNLVASQDIDIHTGELNVLASKDTHTTRTGTKQVEASINQSMYSYGDGAWTATDALSANGSVSESEAKSRTTTYNNSQLLAGDDIHINTTGDMTVSGGNIRAGDNLIARLGGNLTIESKQNRTYSSNKSRGVSAGFGTTDNELSSVSGGVNFGNGRSYSKQTVRSSITGNQVDIDVADHTQLTGATLAAVDDQGQDTGKLTLKTHTFAYRDLTDTTYNNQVSGGVGVNVGIGEKAKDDKTTSQDGEGERTLSVDSSNYQYQNESEQSRRTAMATLGQGELILTGDQTEADATERLNRDVENTEKDIYTIKRQQGNIDVTVDHRIFSEKGREEILQEFISVERKIDSKIPGFEEREVERVEESMREGLKAHGYSDAEIEEVIADYKSSGLLDDMGAISQQFSDLNGDFNASQIYQRDSALSSTTDLETTLVESGVKQGTDDKLPIVTAIGGQLTVTSFGEKVLDFTVDSKTYIDELEGWKQDAAEIALEYGVKINPVSIAVDVAVNAGMEQLPEAVTETIAVAGNKITEAVGTGATGIATGEGYNQTSERLENQETTTEEWVEGSGWFATTILGSVIPSSILGKKKGGSNDNQQNTNSDSASGGYQQNVLSSENNNSYTGGPHKETTKPVGDGLDSHHCPAKACYKNAPISSQDGPAIKMDPGDHRQTASHGSSPEAKAYRKKQKELVDQGKVREAVQMDIDDLKSKFGNKYDSAIKDMELYLDTLSPQDFINQ